MRLAALALAALAAAAAGLPGGGRTCGQAAPPRDYERELFMAVLEGCYAEGVSTEAAEIMARIDAASGWPEHFVQGCPVCMPAVNALRTYALRPKFYKEKIERDTFGPGLAEVEMEALRSPDRQVRLQMIEALVERWTARRMELLRLTPDERDAWRREMEVRRKKGMAMLESLRESALAQGQSSPYVSMKTCAFCDGANGACRVR